VIHLQVSLLITNVILYFDLTQISHFMTRLAVSSCYDLAQNFIEIESKLFEFRLLSCTDSQIQVS